MRIGRTLLSPAATHDGPDALDLIAPRIPNRLLADFGVSCRPGREDSSIFYLLRAQILVVDPRPTNLLVELGTPEGDVILATMPWLDSRVLEHLCWVVLTIHPTDGDRWHRHILRMWPTDLEAADTLAARQSEAEREIPAVAQACAA